MIGSCNQNRPLHTFHPSRLFESPMSKLGVMFFPKTDRGCHSKESYAHPTVGMACEKLVVQESGTPRHSKMSYTIRKRSLALIVSLFEGDRQVATRRWSDRTREGGKERSERSGGEFLSASQAWKTDLPLPAYLDPFAAGSPWPLCKYSLPM